MLNPLPTCLMLLAASAPRVWADEPAQDEEEEHNDTEERELDSFEPLAEQAEPQGPYHHPLSPFASLSASACLPITDLDIGAHGGLAVGAWLPWIGGRLLPAAELGFASAGSSGRIEDERLPDGEAYTWDLALRQLELGGSLRMRALRGDARLGPELTVAAHAVRVHHLLEGRIGSSATEPIHELGWHPGWRATAGVAIDLGAGWLTIDLGYRSVPLSSVIAGDTSLEGLVAGLGFRGTP